MHPHRPVWHSQLPGWVSQINDRATLTSVIQNHIKNLAGRYAGKVRSWDVVNEMFNEDGTPRSSVFFNVLGTSFVNIAFQAARQADPSAVLYINDYKCVLRSVPRSCVLVGLTRVRCAASTA